jgi:hypothetical protein
MADEPLEMLVFADKDGNYYAIARAVWEQARVPDDYKGEVERLVGAPEVGGFGFGVPAPMQIGSFVVPSTIHPPNTVLGWVDVAGRGRTR